MRASLSRESLRFLYKTLFPPATMRVEVVDAWIAASIPACCASAVASDLPPATTLLPPVQQIQCRRREDPSQVHVIHPEKDSLYFGCSLHEAVDVHDKVDEHGDIERRRWCV